MIQLAPYKDKTRAVGFPALRWQQTYEYGYTPNPKLKGVFTAVACDLPDFKSPFMAYVMHTRWTEYTVAQNIKMLFSNSRIHPRPKRQIAERLFLGAVQVAYDDDSEGRFQGPFPSSMTLDGSHLKILYDNGEDLDVHPRSNFEASTSTPKG